MLLGISSVFLRRNRGLCGWRVERHAAHAAGGVGASAVMGVTQYLLVTNGLWTLGATGGAMVGLLVGVALMPHPGLPRPA